MILTTEKFLCPKCGRLPQDQCAIHPFDEHGNGPFIPYYPDLVDMRTKSGQEIFERNFGKREKMKQVRREQARELRKRRS